MQTTKNKIYTLFLFSLLLYFGFVVLLFFLQRNFLYHPHTDKPDISTAPWAQPLSVETSDGLTLHGWWRAPAMDGKPVVVFFHGNAGHIGHRLSDAQRYIQQGYGLIMAEYRGYGGNLGTPTEQGLYKDGRAYLDWVTGEEGFSPADIILHGESLGSGVATQMASEYDVKALILEVPFSSILDMAKFRYPLIPFMELLVKDPFRNDLKIGALSMPVFIALAGQDNIVPIKFGQKLFDAATEPKTLKIYPHAGHNELGQPEFSKSIIAFIETL